MSKLVLFNWVYCIPGARSQEPMAREPDMDLLIMAFGSFVDKHKLAHIKKRSAHTRFQK